ncbi:putative glyoxylase CFP32 [Longispora fulva]|uniref:Putative enzyme related to lactoylglutathione lyase n=1 Tax=Longispora fulva TaxID=619741 RepID=A0A8J7GAR0_9ACTN|nr:VOC family protein [Longispora fulva]MBG6134919.1 putative enzyme related to lactoylglutathione lyase [Longispora fulva]GIG56849.1 putative glyoxylase CFP32 [Longispora fulva]
MKVDAPYAQGTPCWVELMAPADQRGAIGFYKAVFGWTGEPGPAEFGGYTMMLLDGRPVAGIGVTMPQQPPTFWATYLAADAADDVAGRIGTSGGQVLMPPMDVPPVGRILLAADPTGAVFGVWQAHDFFGAQVVNEPGAWTWNELDTPDAEAAAPFYAEAFGITVPPMIGRSDYRVFTVADRHVAGLQQVTGPPRWSVYFAVTDPDATAAACVRAGGQIVREPADVPGVGRVAVLLDPQDAEFSVISPT